ncbi:uncharacterized protein LOC123923893 isoform X2 [Trifolium pratense]|uniref:uncharacterized protein LOC123923893 isoform X2 n=1 Tax=Trifolium pratense TaxID=57577 RepID=UPI001E6909A6|nr:uncharacterized protein LOC123923893 isoform X2 [Trifolium pratense]
MASSSSSSHGRCLLHNHSHHHHCPHCPLRRHCLHCPLHINNPLQPLNQTQNLPPLLNQPIITSPPHAQISQELEHIELDGDEEDDEPVFVLTDEWREFFAKSEAKRKLEKKQAKKGKK